MADFEELKLSVTLTDDASAGLANLRQQITGLTQAAGQVQTSFQGVAQSVAQVGNAANAATPHLVRHKDALKEVEKAAGDTASGMMQMVLSTRGGISAIPQLALGLRQAVGGFNALTESVGALSPELAATIAPLGGVVLGITAIGTAAIAYGVSVFKFSQQMNQLALSARSIGVGFGELKNMVDFGDKFGQTSEQVVSGAAKMAKALTDLGENGSKLRQQLQGQGADPKFLAAVSNVDDLRVASNMIREYGLAVEKAELARGRTRIQARQHANELVESLGGDASSMDRQAIPAADPAMKQQLEFVKDSSAVISRIWGDIKETLGSLSLDVLTVGLPLVSVALQSVWAGLKLVEGTFTAIKIAVDGIITGVKIIAQTLTGDFSGALKSFKELGLRTGDRIGFGGHQEEAKPGDPPKNSDRWWHALNRWDGDYNAPPTSDEARAKLREAYRARQQQNTNTGRSIQLPNTPEQFRFDQPAAPSAAPGSFNDRWGSPAAQKMSYNSIGPNPLRGANDNVRQVAFRDGFGADSTSSSGSSEDRLQGIIKGGVFDALVEFSTYLRTGGTGKAGGTGGIVNASFGGDAGAAAGGGAAGSGAGSGTAGGGASSFGSAAYPNLGNGPNAAGNAGIPQSYNGGANDNAGGGRRSGGGTRSPAETSAGTVATAQGTTKGVTPEGMAMLDTIATREAEGQGFNKKTGERTGWNAMVGGAKFDPGTEEHPHKAYPGMQGFVGGAGRSYASGRYQETTATYYENVARSKKLHPGMHVSGWTPEAQNIRNWDKAQEVYSRGYKKLGIPGLTGNFQKDLEANKNNPEVLGHMSRTLSGEWTSAPGGHENAKQTGGKESYYASTYQKMLGQTSKDPALANQDAPATGPQTSSIDPNQVFGNANVNVPKTGGQVPAGSADEGTPPGAGGVRHEGTGAMVDPAIARSMAYAGSVAGVSTNVAHGDEAGHARHHAGASSGDVDLYDEKGRKLDERNPADRAKMATYIEAAAASGSTGIGFGKDGSYMGHSRMHVGAGTPAVWGAGGHGANAPDWVRDAYNRGRAKQVSLEQQNAAIARAKGVNTNTATAGQAKTSDAGGGYPASMLDKSHSSVPDLPLPQNRMGTSMDDMGSGKADLDRGVLDRKALNDAMSVKHNGSLKVDVSASNNLNAKASYKGDGLFKNTTPQPQTAMPDTPRGPSVADTASSYMKQAS